MTNQNYEGARRGKRFLQVAAICLLLLAAESLRAQFVLDSFDPNANGPVYVVVVQPDGKILLGGGFTNLSPNGGPTVTRRYIARLNEDGSVDAAFNPNANAPVYAIALQEDGKILAGGIFSSQDGEPTIGGQTRNFIARLDGTTGLADSFNPNANARVYAIAVQADGKVLAGGEFVSIGGHQRPRLARLEPDTGLADSFNASIGGNFVYTIVLQPDTKILVGGSFTRIGSQPRNNIARLDPATATADSFNPNANGKVNTIAVQADGKILAGGQFLGANSIGGQERNGIARLDPFTGLADSFNPNPPFNTPINSIVVQPDGNILAGGFFPSIGGQMRSAIARLDPVTGLADSFDPNPKLQSADFAGVSAIAVQAGGKVLVGGYFNTMAPNRGPAVTRNYIARLEPKRATLGNISTRLRVETGDNAMIGGFIITGTQTKTVIVRGIGPSLPIPGALADPVIEVHDSGGQLVATNDNWNDATTRQQIIESGLAPSNDLESALWGVIGPGAYTVAVRGKNNGTGLGLFEVYDLDPAADSKLANVSTRGLVATGDNVMIGGTIIVGEAPARVLFRAIGPSLASFGVPNALQDPTLQLHNANGELIAINYDWRDDQAAEITATGLAPSNDRESAIVQDLAPGNYTAIVRGSDDTPGVALIEAYDLD
jgi:uncharacterized delta-60 repeat protein